MNDTIDFRVDELLPSPRDVLSAQGVPPGAPVAERVLDCTHTALEMFRALAAPVGVVAEVDHETFSRIVQGDGTNGPDAVVPRISRDAEGLALFAATVGEDVSLHTERLFADREFALAAAMDAVASLAAEGTAKLLEDAFLAELRSRGACDDRSHVLGYSPGYCGWHLCGQRALFDTVRPERIGIALNEQHLMSPMKSVSGVLIAGPTSVHDFRPGFSYCPDCRSRSCQSRISGLRTLDAAVARAP